MDANRGGNVRQAEASETIKEIHSLLRKAVKNGEYDSHHFIHSVQTPMSDVFTPFDVNTKEDETLHVGRPKNY